MIPAAADLSYDYTNYEFDYTSYNTPQPPTTLHPRLRHAGLRCSRSSRGSRCTCS